jgi:hypothetical protein
VLRSTGTGYAEPETWGEVPDCDCVSIMARGR